MKEKKRKEKHVVIFCETIPAYENKRNWYNLFWVSRDQVVCVRGGITEKWQRRFH